MDNLNNFLYRGYGVCFSSREEIMQFLQWCKKRGVRWSEEEGAMDFIPHYSIPYIYINDSDYLRGEVPQGSECVRYVNRIPWDNISKELDDGLVFTY